MNIKIKNVKYSEFASEETHCFQATVYIDGKRAFGVKNDGHGGCDDYFPLDGQNGKELWEQIRKINEELGKETISWEHGTLQNNLELVVDDLLVNWLKQGDARKLLRKIAYIGEDGKTFTLSAKVKPTESNLAAVQKASWWKKDYVLLNNMPIEEVVERVWGGPKEKERVAEESSNRKSAAPAPGM